MSEKNYNERGLSPMVATIVLIGLVMVIAGVLVAGISGGVPDEPLRVSFDVGGLSAGSSEISISHIGGGSVQNAWGLDSDNNFSPNDLTVRVDGLSVAGCEVLVLTSDGENKLGSVGENFDFIVGDKIVLSNFDSLDVGESFQIIYEPLDQVLLEREI